MVDSDHFDIATVLLRQRPGYNEFYFPIQKTISTENAILLEIELSATFVKLPKHSVSNLTLAITMLQPVMVLFNLLLKGFNSFSFLAEFGTLLLLILLLLLRVKYKQNDWLLLFQPIGFLLVLRTCVPDLDL